MKQYIIEWETDYCEGLPEKSGKTVVKANTEDEAVKKFYAQSIPKAVIIDLYERKIKNVK